MGVTSSSSPGAMTTKLGNMPQVRRVEDAVVRRAIGSGQARAVEGEGHRKVLQRHFLEDLVKRSLKEGGVDIDDRPKAALGEPRRERDGVRFADADVEKAIGKVGAELFELVALTHGGGDDRDARVVSHRDADGGRDGVGEGAHPAAA